MSAAAGCELICRWPIVEADLWDRDHLDLVEPAYMTLGKGAVELINGLSRRA